MVDGAGPGLLGLARAMPDPGPSPRGHVRARCHIRLGGKLLPAWTASLGPTGLYALAERSRALAALEPGDRLAVIVRLGPGADPLSAMAEVAWVNPHDWDVFGREAVGLGLRFGRLRDEAARALDAFLEGYRPGVLLVDGEPSIEAPVRRALGDDYRLRRSTSAEQALEVVGRGDVAVVVVDHSPGRVDGIELLTRLSGAYPHLRLVKVLVGDEAELEAVRELFAAIRDLVPLDRVFHFVRRPVDEAFLAAVVRHAVDVFDLSAENDRMSRELERTAKRLRGENAYLRRRLEGIAGFEELVGTSQSLRRSLAQLDRVMRTDVSVHIAGETGTGKELVARALHRGGPRGAGPFVAQNCAGLTETLLQSALFGHVRGAFTGADRDRPGVFQEADGGTLFLDEVAELSPATQGLLLRALQQGEVQPVGVSRPVAVDVRIISATHEDLRRAVATGRFRQDLFYRLVVVSVELPPLRDRSGDIALLAQHFLELYRERHGKHVPGFCGEAMVALEAHRWPGNVRELENEVERAVVLAEEGLPIGLDLLSPAVASHGWGEEPSTSTSVSDIVVVASGEGYDAAVESVQRTVIQQALTRSGGVVAEAARRLGMERTRLAKLRKRLGIE